MAGDENYKGVQVTSHGVMRMVGGGKNSPNLNVALPKMICEDGAYHLSSPFILE